MQGKNPTLVLTVISSYFCIFQPTADYVTFLAYVSKMSADYGAKCDFKAIDNDRFVIPMEVRFI